MSTITIKILDLVGNGRISTDEAVRLIRLIGRDMGESKVDRSTAETNYQSLISSPLDYRFGNEFRLMMI